MEVLALFFGSHALVPSYGLVDAGESLYFFLLQEYSNYFLPPSGTFPAANLQPTSAYADFGKIQLCLASS